eukprot:TRINITY_DN8175_c0_g1_i1.p1 TRINITY_DN8175_c0_g1~~TRINITY_DN8175_c0_g1_i1.p1  ORF type:complete len:619 (+),score=213.01 TRINITY_DN8175_c0_g1_i1:140-1996(+)
MEFLSEYGDDTEVNETGPALFESVLKKQINICPEVDRTKVGQRYHIPANSSSVNYNPEYDVLWAPTQGPQHPVLAKSRTVTGSVIPTGWAETYHTDSVSFHEQFYAFNALGVAVNPDTNSAAVRARQKPTAENYQRIQHEASQKEGDSTSKDKRKRNFGDPGDIEGYSGPWAVFPDETERNARLHETHPSPAAAAGSDGAPSAVKQLRTAGDVAAAAAEAEVGDGEEGPRPARTVDEAAAARGRRQRDYDEIDDITADVGARRRGEAPGAQGETPEGKTVTYKSIYHPGGQLRDYLGRTFVDPPTHLKPGIDHECFVPKKLIHTFSGHNKEVNDVKLFPKTGHLALSAGFDGKVKIWDLYGKRKCVRTYLGHQKGVRSVEFNADGRRFLSVAYDKTICMWDTETGECLGSYTNNKLPLVAKFNPLNETEILAGYKNHKLLQWDTNSGKIVQEYDQHLDAVNTITFVDEGRRFVSSSDDKSLRVWEYGIPVVIKYICEPHMHSMPAITLHPQGTWIACQSLDNQILIYSTKDRFRLNKKKRFAGHLNAGYACQIAFSPDSHFIATGDADGNVFIWDFNTQKLIKRWKAHQGACIGLQWHPIEPSWIVSSGWDNSVKLWD